MARMLQDDAGFCGPQSHRYTCAADLADAGLLAWQLPERFGL